MGPSTKWLIAEPAPCPDFPRGIFGAVEDGQEEAVRFVNAWKAQVMREVPADRLLVWQVKEGWGLGYGETRAKPQNFIY